MVATGDGLSVYYFGEDGPLISDIVAEGIIDSRKSAMKLVADAVCHAINSGADYFELLRMVGRMRAVSTSYAFTLGDDWETGTIEATLQVAYWQFNAKTEELVRIIPDVSHDLRALRDWEAGSACQ